MKVVELYGSLEGARSLAGSTATGMEAADPRLSPDTEETRVDQQDSVKIDPEMAHVKLRRATEQVNLLEGKFQQAVNENAKLKVKQTEYSRLWQGLDSKLSSTKTFCDELTETLQQLASQTEQAEEDKKLFEEIFEKNSKNMDEFNCLFHDLSTKLDDAERQIISGRQEMLQIKQEKEEMKQSYEEQLYSKEMKRSDKERLYSNDTTIKEKDSLIKQLEGSIDEIKSRLICLDSRLHGMEQQLKLNNDVCISLKGNLASSESEKNSLELMNKRHILETEKLWQDNKDLKELLSSFMVKVTELDKEHASVSSHVCRLISSFERFYEMAQEEKMLMARSSKDKFEHLQSQYVDLTPENNALKNKIEELMLKLIELQITREIVMVQHVEECQVAEDKIRRLESEAEVSASNIKQLEKLAHELQGRIQNHKELLGQMKTTLEEESSNAESLQGEITKRDQQVNTLENQINQLYSVLDEKEQLYLCSVEREKTLENQKLEVEALLSATECQLNEAKIELSLKHDQAINEIDKKYEHDKIEITNAEKEKANKLIMEIESQCEEKISQNKLDFERYLICLKEEHGNMVARIQQDNEHKESTLRDYHKEVLQHRSQVENELRERLSFLSKEHEREVKSLWMHHEKECQRMQEELELQKSKEEKQTAWLQSQWKEMMESHQVDHEVNSKKLTCTTNLMHTPSNTYVLSMNTNIPEAPNPSRPQKDNDIWDKRQIMYVLVLTTTVGLVFLLQPLLPVAYGRWIIFVIATLWGIGSIGLPVGLYGTSRYERDFSRHTGRLVYTLFSVLVIYGFYLLAMHTGDTSSSTLSPSLKEGAVDVNEDTSWTVWFGVIGSLVLIGNIWSSIRGCSTGGDKDP